MVGCRGCLKGSIKMTERFEKIIFLRNYCEKHAVCNNCSLRNIDGNCSCNGCIEDWEEVKDQIMYEICLAKFTQNEELKEKLLATGNEELVEGNTWHDTYWGVCNRRGKNKLGKILMRVRSELK